MRKIQIAFGSLSKPLIDQLEGQGVVFDSESRKKIDAAQRDYNAILRLRVRNLITSSQCDSAVKKLIKSIDEIISV